MKYFAATLLFLLCVLALTTTAAAPPRPDDRPRGRGGANQRQPTRGRGGRNAGPPADAGAAPEDNANGGAPAADADADSGRGGRRPPRGMRGVSSGGRQADAAPNQRRRHAAVREVPVDVSITDIAVVRFRASEEHLVGNVSFALFGAEEPAIVDTFKSMFRSLDRHGNPKPGGAQQCRYRGSVVSRVAKHSHIQAGAAVPGADPAPHAFFPKSTRAPRTATNADADPKTLKQPFLRGSLATVYETSPSEAPVSAYPEQFLVLTKSGAPPRGRRRGDDAADAMQEWATNHTVFGQILQGLHQTLNVMEQAAHVDRTTLVPSHPIVIDDCWVYEGFGDAGEEAIHKFVDLAHRVEREAEDAETAKVVLPADEVKKAEEQHAKQVEWNNKRLANATARAAAAGTPPPKQADPKAQEESFQKRLHAKKRTLRQKAVRSAFARPSGGAAGGTAGTPEGSSFGLASKSLSHEHIGGPESLSIPESTRRRREAERSRPSPKERTNSRGGNRRGGRRGGEGGSASASQNADEAAPPRRNNNQGPTK